MNKKSKIYDKLMSIQKELTQIRNQKHFFKDLIYFNVTNARLDNLFADLNEIEDKLKTIDQNISRANLNGLDLERKKVKELFDDIEDLRSSVRR